jgi:NAD(P)-dependent dehydrogenase (short-subunit alcohol dehydrogenase family)
LIAEVESSSVLISKSNLRDDSLEGQVVIVTGGGRGIGFEAAKALTWLGAKVIIAEVNERTGLEAQRKLQFEFGSKGKAVFFKTDLGNDDDISNLEIYVHQNFGNVDAVLNNAAALPIGDVKDAPISNWDLSYRVNLRGPILLARTFLPEMIQRNRGVFVCVSSSGAAPHMGPYEVFKTAQVELANTMSAELEGTEVYAFAIGPGMVKTPGFLEAGSKVAAMMGITVDQLLEMNKSFVLSPEEAGTGFAGAIALASKYSGSETSSVQVLRDIGISSTRQEQQLSEGLASYKDSAELMQKVLKTYGEQSQGWKKMNVFYRQWVMRDFKKQTGMSVDEMSNELTNITNSISQGEPKERFAGTLQKLLFYYKHQKDLVGGFEKDPKKLEENRKAIQGWIDDLQGLLGSSP